MAKLAPRRLAPMRTLKQLKHIRCEGPRCTLCGERIYKVDDSQHTCKPKK